MGHFAGAGRDTGAGRTKPAEDLRVFMGTSQDQRSMERSIEDVFT